MNKESFSFVVYMIHACANKWNMMPSEVFRVVDMYHTGIWDKERALKVCYILYLEWLPLMYINVPDKHLDIFALV